jgi:hypothetical protein
MDDDDSSNDSDVANDSHMGPAFDAEDTYSQLVEDLLTKGDSFFF